ncbi:MAG: glycine cleavage system protein GcvH [Chlamydiales bacterium]|nr:glycine cleavage system protein GcvH [Chlamydiales bacterium]
MREYTKSHEWVDKEGNIATVGITKAAVKEVGDIVYVELPKVGKTVAVGQDACVIESTKAAVDISSPVSGTILSVNDALLTNIQLLNDLPESDGWLFKVTLS